MHNRKLNEANVPEHLRVIVHYRTDTGWMSTCRLVERDSDRLVGLGVAFCSSKDNPNRKIGRAIAVGRALKRYWENVDAGEV